MFKLFNYGTLFTKLLQNILHPYSGMKSNSESYNIKHA